MKSKSAATKRILLYGFLACALFVTVTIARRGSDDTWPKADKVVEGVTTGGHGSSLCIGRSADDPRATCAPVEYPGREDLCAFMFKETGDQEIIARYVISPQPAWQPITLDGHALKC